MTGQKSPQIKYFIIGQLRCGTTSLHAYLTQHPQISGDPKEPHTFGPYKPLPFKGNLDATPFYLNNCTIPKRVYNYNRDAKVILLIRNPVVALWSFYWKERFFKHTQSADEFVHRMKKALKTPNTTDPQLKWFINRSSYGLYQNLEIWQAYFPDMMIIQSEDFFADPEKIILAVHKYFGVEPIPIPKTEYIKHNARAQGKPPAEAFEILKDYYSERWNEIWNKTKKLYI